MQLCGITSLKQATSDLLNTKAFDGHVHTGIIKSKL